MPVETELRGSAYATVGPKIYVMGGFMRSKGAKLAHECEHSSDVWVLDYRYHTWECGPSMLVPCWFKFSTWRSVAARPFPAHLTKPKPSCVVDGVPFPYNRGKFEWFDEKLGVYKELKGAIEGKPKYLCGHSLINLEDRLVVIFAEARSSGDAIDSEEGNVGVWCAEIDVMKDENGDWWGRVHWLEKVPLLREVIWDNTEAAFVK